MDEKINVNTASSELLEKIIHIGPKRALKIIEKRPYKDLHELSNVSGLGKKRTDDIINEGLAII